MTMGNWIAVMNKGVLQQIGTPALLHTSPTNRRAARGIAHQSWKDFDASMV